MSLRVLRRIACLLVAVLLATILSPSFAWESAASAAAEGHEVLVFGGHEGSTGEHQPGEDSHHHHGCAGHMLGHLTGPLGNLLVLALPELGASALPEPPADFLSSLRARLDRPPLAPIPA
ncbi:MAG TPA: hypothetical protein VF104_08180 [Burkholderiales bacterium]